MKSYNDTKIRKAISDLKENGYAKISNYLEDTNHETRKNREAIRSLEEKLEKVLIEFGLKE